jgi:FKBP-type peptidyl-prolyl cis-trans isomerase
LEGGIVVEVTQWGTGPKAGTTDSVGLTYVLRTAEGEELDSSADKPGSFEVGMDDPATLPGLAIALRELPAGSRANVTIPPLFAFDDRGYADIIPPGATLVMEVEVLEVVPAP